RPLGRPVARPARSAAGGAIERAEGAGALSNAAIALPVRPSFCVAALPVPALFVAPLAVHWSTGVPVMYCVRRSRAPRAPSRPHPDAAVKLGLGRGARSCLSRIWAGPSVRAQNLQRTCRSRGGIVEPIAKQGLLVRGDVHRLRAD